MLSREIYDSWNARSEADLQDLLENISGPHLPNNVRSTSFKKSVLLQIERRKAADKIRITIEYVFNNFYKITTHFQPNQGIRKTFISFRYYYCYFAVKKNPKKSRVVRVCRG